MVDTSDVRNAGAIARVTVAVVPRETLSQARACLETLVATTEPPYRLVVVDAGYPKATRRWLERFVRLHDATLLRADCVLTPNEARNAAMQAVDTEFVVFLDDNCFVQPGWLDALIRCADETGAAIVGPMYGFRTGRHARETVHVFGAEAHIATEGGRRELVDRHFHAGMPLDEAVATMARIPTEAAEFHCLLVRTALFDELGPLDEGLLSTREHLDLCMLAREAGHEVWTDPASVVVYELPMPLPLSDRPFYVLRWCEAWNRASCTYFAQKWGLADVQGFLDLQRFTDERRNVAYRLRPRLLDRAFNKLGGRARRALDRLAQAIVVPRETRRRARSRGTTVVRRATWQPPAALGPLGGESPRGTCRERELPV